MPRSAALVWRLNMRGDNSWQPLTVTVRELVRSGWSPGNLPWSTRTSAGLTRLPANLG